jgi:hypothetical protein
VTKAEYPECIFCSKHNQPSKEDVLAKWIAREFPDRDKSRFEIRKGRFDDASWPDRQFEAVGNLGSITKGPCIPCNNGWMSALESRVRPILVPLMRGESRALAKPQLSVIAQWAVKTALMYEYMRYTEEARYFTAEHRTALYKSLAIPPNTRVFAARYVGDSATYQIGGQIPHFPGAKIRAHSSTIAIKQFAVQVFSFRWLPEHHGSRVLPSIPNDIWAEAQEVVWPNPRSMHWPPRLALDNTGFEAFAGRWRSARLSS